MVFIIFADDTNMFMSNQNYEDLIIQTNAELKKVNLWFEKNKLSLNIKKTSYMLLIPKNKKKIPLDKDVYISNHSLVRVQYAKFLGVYIDEKFNWIKHISFICNKVASQS